MKTTKKTLQFRMIFFGVFLLLSFVLPIFSEIQETGTFSLGSLFGNNAIIIIVFIVVVSSQYRSYRTLKRKKALRFSGKVIDANVDKIFSEYVHKQGMKYYLTATTPEFPELSFTEEFNKKEYEFCKKHLKAGSKLEMFVDYENPKLFLIDFELIERDYTGKLEISENEQFESGTKYSVLSKINANPWKIGGILLIGFGLLSLLPLFLMVQGIDNSIGHADYTNTMQIFGGIAGITILLGIFLFRKGKKDTSTQDTVPDMFSTKPPKGFDGFPS